MGRFLHGTQGTVSVYLIVVLVPIFLFQALFVDFIRIHLASRESEMALKSGLRSAMTRFDQALAEYGLYGLAGEEDEHQEVFRLVLEHNLPQAAEGASWQYTDTRLHPELTELKAVYTLANPSVFQHQVAQEMKLKAPVEFVTEIADKFQKNGAAERYGQGAVYYEQAEKLERLYWKREEALDQAWRSAQELIADAESAARSAGSSLSRLQELSTRIGLRQAAEIRQSIADTERGISALSDQAEALRSSIRTTEHTLAGFNKTLKENASRIQALNAEISRLESSLGAVERERDSLYGLSVQLDQILMDMSEYTALFGASQAAVASAAEAVRTLQTGTEEALNEAMQTEQEWRAEWERLTSNTVSGRQIDNADNPFAIAYPDTFYDGYRTGAAKIAAAFQGLSGRWSGIEWWHAANWGPLSADISRLVENILAYESERRQEETKREARNARLKRESDQYKSKVASVLGELEQALGSCTADPGSDRMNYSRLEGEDGLAAKYRAYHRMPRPVEEERSGLPDRPERAISRGMELLERLKGAMSGLRDELLLNEYVLDKFNFRTLRGASAGPKPGTDPAAHPLRMQEAEYALYGFDSCPANLSAAYGELFLLLFAVRTVEAWMEPGIQAMVGTPLLAVLAAASKGAVQALSDARQLTEGNAVDLFQRFNGFQMTYKDILRLFLLLHPNQLSVMSRVQALIELNTGTDLTRAVTYLHGSSTTSLRLWFMPGMLAWLERTAGLGCETVDGRCRIRKSAVYSYD